jgi:hypothetical protein
MHADWILIVFPWWPDVVCQLPRVLFAVSYADLILITCCPVWCISYREFYALDTALRAAFPDMDAKLHRLPAKEFFGNLSPHVIYRRQRAFEVR